MVQKSEEVSIEDRLNDHRFRQPGRPDTPLWRYLSVPKFVWLIARKALYFPRLDLLGDKYEGAAAISHVEIFKSRIRRTYERKRGREITDAEMTAFVNSLTYPTYESEAMWRIFVLSARVWPFERPTPAWSKALQIFRQLSLVPSNTTIPMAADTTIR